MFRFFHKKINEDEMINSHLESLKQDMFQKLFYGKKKDACSLMKSMIGALYPNAKITIEQCKFSVFFYIQVWTRVHGGFSPDSSKKWNICEAMKKRFGQFPSSAVDQATDVCIDYIVDNEPAIKQRVLEPADSEAKEESKINQENLEKILQLLMANNDINKMIQESAKENAEKEEKHLDDPDYGLVPEKPVFIGGFGAHREYLNSLRTENDETMEYSRIGSMSVDGIAGKVDVYKLTPKDSKDQKKIYLCLYGSRTSTKAPKGFKLVSTRPGEPSNTEVQAPITFF